MCQDALKASDTLNENNEKLRLSSASSSGFAILPTEYFECLLHRTYQCVQKSFICMIMFMYVSYLSSCLVAQGRRCNWRRTGSTPCRQISELQKFAVCVSERQVTCQVQRSRQNMRQADRCIHMQFAIFWQEKRLQQQQGLTGERAPCHHSWRSGGTSQILQICHIDCSVTVYFKCVYTVFRYT